MKTRPIAVLTCCALLALGGCSGSSDKKITDNTPTAAETALAAADMALTAANDALTAAMEAVAKAESDAAAADTLEKRTAARKALADAKKAVADAKAYADAAVEAAAGLDADVLAKAATAKERAYAYETSSQATLVGLDARLTTWASNDIKPGGQSEAIAGEVKVARRPRAEDDGTVIESADRLSIATERVAYAPGKTVLGPAGDGTTDELPLEMETVREFKRVQGVAAGGTSNVDGTLKGSIELTRDGLVMKLRGNAIYYDMQRRFDVGENPDSWAGIGPDGKREEREDNTWVGGVDSPNWIHDDLTIEFGNPSPSPDGDASWYWQARVDLPDGADASRIARLRNKEHKDLGRYELWLSNYAGTQIGEVDEDGSRATEQRHLSHAAYGLFHFLDNMVKNQDEAYTRLQSLHFGYDAFADTKDMVPISGTFNGRTLATLMKRDDSYRVGGATDEVTRLQGDIEIEATIGALAIGGGNTIRGTIDKFKQLSEEGWEDYTDVTSVALVGTIASDGAYQGAATATVPDGTPFATKSEGNFSGAFYGPRDGLETAGIWDIRGVTDGDASAGKGAAADHRIIGSYGAVCTKGCSSE